MAGSVNKVILIGNLGKDPEIRTLPNGERVANFSLATSESWRDKMTGERKEKTEWHRIACFNDNISKIIEQYVRKGSKLYVEVALQTRKWTDQAGVEKYSTEIVISRFSGNVTLLDGRSDSGGAQSGGGSYDQGGYDPQAQAGPKAQGAGAPVSFDMDDEIPF